MNIQLFAYLYNNKRFKARIFGYLMELCELCRVQKIRYITNL